jgi:hypothetical protein
LRTITTADAIAAGLTIHERPRPQLSGRQDDIEQPHKAVTTSRLETAVRVPEAPLETPLWLIPPQERRQHLSARSSAVADKYESSWVTSHGTVAVADKVKTYTGKCTECTQSFTVSRPASRRGKWPSLCSDECRKTRKRRQDASALKKHRQRR